MHPHETYKSQNILAASPLELIEMLYRGALESVQAARCFLASGAIHDRSRQVSKAIAILAELSSALNHEHGGDLSRNLGALYDYLQRSIIDANTRQVDEPLEQAERLLGVLLSGWRHVRAATEASEVSTAPGYDNPIERQPISVSY